MLKTTECISIEHSGMNYTDCMEFSLLRFLQLLLFDPEEIEDHEYSCYHVPSDAIRIHPALLSYVTENPYIYPDALYYTTSPSGTQERCDWAKLVSFRKEFQYYRNDSAELFTNIANIFTFLELFCGLTPQQFGVSSRKELYAPKKDLARYNRIFDHIGKVFSTTKKQIRMELQSQRPVTQYMTVRQCKAFISRPENKEYDQYDHSRYPYRVNLINSVIRLSINDLYHYDWHLYELYFDADQERSLNLRNRLLTGHSVIHRHRGSVAPEPNIYDHEEDVD
jgi:hypothetical protein